MININKSFVHFYDVKNSERVSVKSVLSTENKKIFLLKECRSETISEHPFLHLDRYEFFSIIENDKTHLIRTSPVDSKKENIELSNPLKKKHCIVESDVNYLNFEKVNEIVTSGKTDNIYSEIKYQHEGIKYNLISKCEFINYNTEKNSEKYLQPIMGYVPFVHKNQLRYGYVVLHITEKKNGYLEFLLNEKTGILNTNPKQNLIRLNIKKILNMFLFFVKKNDFTKVISIKESKINFFTYN
ncbi:hypothetical protein OAJ72_01810 [Pelagibacteraceae bacterium]|nr:hypothetical protein [Pelagibacteraceae bacterium]